MPTINVVKNITVSISRIGKHENKKMARDGREPKSV